MRAAQRKLAQLDAATRLDDLRVPPANRLEALAGKLRGLHSIRVNEPVKGKRGVSAETAWLLAQAFGTTPQFWINLQSNYDLARTQPVHSVAKIQRAS